MAELVGPSMKPVHSQKLLISAYVVINSRDKNVVIARFRDKNVVTARFRNKNVVNARFRDKTAYVWGLCYR